jgi:thioredoxin-related protein
MKKLIQYTAVVFLFGCFDRQKLITGLEGKPLPSFNMLLTDSITNINTKSIPLGEPFVLFYFSPSCPYCRAQTEEIKDEIKSLEKIKIYFIAGFPLQQIKNFNKHYELSAYPNLTVAQVNDSSFFKYYNITGVPYIAIYNKEKKLKEIMFGKVPTDEIRNIALEN